MAVGYDIVVNSVGDVWKGNMFVIVVTKKGVTLHNKNGDVVTSVLYPHIKLRVLKIFEHTPFVRVINGDSYKNLEYESLSKAKDAYRLFKLAIKNSKLDYVEQAIRVATLDAPAPDRDVNSMIFRACLRLKADDFEIVFMPLRRVYTVEDWAKEKINKTFKEVRW